MDAKMSCGALILLFLLFLVLGVGWALLVAYPVMWAWNAIANNFDWTPITYWVSVAIVFITSFISGLIFRPNMKVD